MWKTYRDVYRGLSDRLHAQLARDSGLSGSEYAVLVELSHAPDHVLRARELCAQLSWDRSRLSHLIGRMEKRGLVTREDCATDARGSMVRLTDAGRAAVEEVAPEHSEAIRRYFFNPLSDVELETLNGLLERLLRNLEADQPYPERSTSATARRGSARSSSRMTAS
jgi:DNA-binding MarR family transcriptional regulator